MGVVAGVDAPGVTCPGVRLAGWVGRVRRSGLGVGVRVRHGLRVSLYGLRGSRVMTRPGLHGVLSWIQRTPPGEENSTTLRLMMPVEKRRVSFLNVIKIKPCFIITLP